MSKPKLTKSCRAEEEEEGGGGGGDDDDDVVRWEDDVRNDLRKMGVTNWKQRTQERKQWKGIIEQGKTHKEL